MSIKIKGKNRQRYATRKHAHTDGVFPVFLATVGLAQARPNNDMYSCVVRELSSNIY